MVVLVGAVDKLEQNIDPLRWREAVVILKRCLAG